MTNFWDIQNKKYCFFYESCSFVLAKDLLLNLSVFFLNLYNITIENKPTSQEAHSSTFISGFWNFAMCGVC